MFRMFLLGGIYPTYASYNSIISKSNEDIKSWLVYWVTFFIILFVYRLSSFLPFIDQLVSYTLIYLQHNKDFRNSLLEEYIVPRIKKYKYKVSTYINIGSLFSYIVLQYANFTVTNSKPIVIKKSNPEPLMY